MHFLTDDLKFHTSASSFFLHSLVKSQNRVACTNKKCKPAEPDKLNRDNIDADNSPQTCEFHSTAREADSKTKTTTDTQLSSCQKKKNV
jgi:hypothetical protein